MNAMDDSARQGNASTVPCSIACTGCGYDLRGLYVGNRCPECARDVRASVPSCPRCSASRGEVVALDIFEGLEGAWTCELCGGMAFDKEGLSKTLTSRDRTAPRTSHARVHDLEVQGRVLCGRCKSACRQISIGDGIIIDRCTKCMLVWVDKGELAPLAAFVKKHAGGSHVPPRVDLLLDRPRDIGAATGKRTAIGIALEVLSCVFLWL